MTVEYYYVRGRAWGQAGSEKQQGHFWSCGDFAEPVLARANVTGALTGGLVLHSEDLDTFEWLQMSYQPEACGNYSGLPTELECMLLWELMNWCLMHLLKGLWL